MTLLRVSKFKYTCRCPNIVKGVFSYFQDGKNHVTFPEFQQNGSAKQFTHGKIKYYRLGTYLFFLTITSVDRMHVWVKYYFRFFFFIFKYIHTYMYQRSFFIYFASTNAFVLH